MKKNLPLYLSIGAVLLFCIVLIGYVFFMTFSSSEGEETPAEDARSVSKEEATQTLNQFVEALKAYDINKMSQHLSSFPDKNRNGTIDDMYNDEVYQQIYRQVYPTITYELKEYSDNCATISVTMPNIKMLYQNAAMKLNLGAMDNEELRDKLLENDTNAVILYQQLMLYEVMENNGIQQMTQQYILTFDRAGDKIQIVADDQLCAFLTGDFSTTRNLPGDSEE